MSMRHKKFIERNERYDIVQWKFKGIPITFRFWKNGSQIAEIKVDENFAKANGYESVEDMAEKTIGQAKFNEMFGVFPNGLEPMQRKFHIRRDESYII